MNKVSDRINRLAESATLAMARMSRELKGLGKDVLSKVILLGKNRGYTFLWLGVWEQNKDAIAF